MNEPLGGNEQDDRIAIVGFAGRFPGGHDAQTIWPALRDGVELHHHSSNDELSAAGHSVEDSERADLVRQRPLLTGPEQFDATLFGYSAMEAATCDPQQRVFLEVAYSAFEHAGIDPTRFDGVTGVYAGGGPDTYLHSEVLPHADPADPAAHLARVVGNERDFLAPRVAYKLGTSGPALTVLSGCATSLVAVHLATQSLLSGETDLCLAGGATIFFPQKGGYFYHSGGIVSPDGRCRPFSQDAAGTVTGDAAAAVVLRRLEDAVRDGDTIHAVISGSAVNNDGAGKVGFTAPSVAGQAAAVAEALAVAGLAAGDIDYVETHGTATAIGDGIEVEALNAAYAGAPSGSCILGALKPNIGHTDTAAGVSALIKVILSLQNDQIAPIAGFSGPHPDIDFAGGPTRPADSLLSWPQANGRPRRAGVSAFSIGGTNCHVIVEDPPAPSRLEASDAQTTSIAVMSAATTPALDELTAQVANAQADAISLATTLARGRRQHPVRRAAVLAAGADVAATISDAARQPAVRASSGDAAVLLFGGQGTQFPGMGSELYRDSVRYREALDEVLDAAELQLRKDLSEVLAPSSSPEQLYAHIVRLTDTALTQPALFGVQYASARTVLGLGIEPAALLGHSIGEYAAATVAGVLSLPDALAVVTARGRLIADTTPGSMAALSTDEATATGIAAESGAAIAAVNSPLQIVLSGSAAQIDAARALAAAQEVRLTQLQVQRAFHSHLLDDAVAPMREILAGVTLSPPRIPLASAATGGWWGPEEATSPDCWARQLRDPVRFADAASAVAAQFPDAMWIEAGAGTALGTAVRACGHSGPSFSVLGRPDDVPLAVGTAEARVVARLWESGVDVDRLSDSGYFGAPDAPRAVLPGYPFERRTYRFSELMTGDPHTAAPRPDLGSGFVEPRTDVERLVSEAMASALGLREVGITDEFFALGGDSVAATGLAAQLAETFGVEVSVGHVVNPPATPESIAASVEQLAQQTIDRLSDEEVARLLTG
ncbi:MAG: type I polyketide synthase [Cumulibacter sp.]